MVGFFTLSSYCCAYRQKCRKLVSLPGVASSYVLTDFSQEVEVHQRATTELCDRGQDVMAG